MTSFQSNKSLSITYSIQGPKNYLALLDSLLKKTYRVVKKKLPEVSLAFISPAAIKKLHHRYLGQAKVTDVLSFEEVNEIVICYSQAKKQARLENKSIKVEVSLLFVHGLLHLLGYNHATKSQSLKMQKAQVKILGQIPNRELI